MNRIGLEVDMVVGGPEASYQDPPTLTSVTNELKTNLKALENLQDGTQFKPLSK